MRGTAQRWDRCEFNKQEGKHTTLNRSIIAIHKRGGFNCEILKSKQKLS